MSVSPTKHLPVLRRRGFWLFEMLVTIILFVACAAIAEQLFISTFRVSRDARAAQDATASLEAGLNVLRGDTWAANQIALSNPQKAELTGADGEKITWSLSADRLSRQTGERQTHWQSPKGATFSADGISLSYKLAPTKAEPTPPELRMTSQALVVAKLSP